MMGLQITVSIGVAEVDSDDDLAACLRRADVAMYQAKEADRNTVRPTVEAASAWHEGL